MARAAEDVKYRGRRRWNGSHGKVWWDGELLFEIESFECKVTALTPIWRSGKMAMIRELRLWGCLMIRMP